MQAVLSMGHLGHSRGGESEWDGGEQETCESVWGTESFSREMNGAEHGMSGLEQNNNSYVVMNKNMWNNDGGGSETDWNNDNNIDEIIELLNNNKSRGGGGEGLNNNSIEEIWGSGFTDVNERTKKS